MPWPTANDLLDFLKAARLVAATPTVWQGLLDLDLALAAAIEAFENETHYLPFLADDVYSSRRYTPGGLCLLDLDGGILDVEVFTADSKTLTLDTDYFLMPANAVAQGKPYTYIEFAEPRFGKRNSLVITAKWGYATEVPAKAKQTILASAAFLLSPQIASGIAKGLIRLTEGDQTKEWGSKPLDAIAEGWEAQSANGIAFYKRLRMA